MRKPLQLKLAKRRGEITAAEHGFDSLPVKPKRIAAMNDIEVRAKPDSVEGVSGMLLRHGDKFGIMYATHIRSDGFQNFSIAHELGHYFLDGHIGQILPKDGIHQSRAGFVEKDTYELEADHFAAGLLMPERPFRRVMGRVEPGLDAIRELSDACETSLEATAIRYAEVTDDAVAVILSTGTRINYCSLSDQVKSLPNLDWLRPGSEVPKGTGTFHFNRTIDRVQKAESDHCEIDLQDWLSGDRSIPASEEFIGLGRYGKTLTVVSCPSVKEDAYFDETEDELSDEEMMDRWVPKFRR